jgi:Na+-translocating ferredoxin:NAD+ oxidoreductase RnfD subunit
MKNGFVKKNKIFGINMFYILGILPIILFAFYKNGLMVYKTGELSLWLSLQYLIIPIIIILLSYVFETYYYLCIKKDDDLNNVVNSVTPYINALCYLVCGPANKLFITIPIIVVLDVVMKFLENKICVNRVALFKCILFGVLTLLSMSSNLNYHEATLKVVESDPTKLFLGMGVGEIGVTSALFAIVGYCILLFNNYFKKEIPVICVVTYFLVSLLFYFGDVVTFKELLANTFNSGFIFVAVFVASLTTATPVVRSGRIIYSILIGLIGAIMVNLVQFYVGIYFGVLVVSLLTPVLNKFKLSIE